MIRDREEVTEIYQRLTLKLSKALNDAFEEEGVANEIGFVLLMGGLEAEDADGIAGMSNMSDEHAIQVARMWADRNHAVEVRWEEEPTRKPS